MLTADKEGEGERGKGGGVEKKKVVPANDRLCDSCLSPRAHLPIVR
ncbi:Glycosyltransferase-like protein gnt13 [Frankliniella fusca]|uniref:Glycosyltransferase-like protein gnt13 n=1 Tax=Frankliniella fusca TaxID=407009 RepID=A0AAE1HDK0_9NEOP|nr:Glycosyltransferase-like protein gnt13 [Frankliniella fusca]